MSKVYARLIRLGITSTLAASWLYDMQNLKVFHATIFWIVCLAVFISGLYICHCIVKFDEGLMSKEDASRVFKPLSSKTLFDRFFAGFISSTNVTLLVLIGSPVLAVFYLASTLCTLKLGMSCIKRYEIIKAE